MFSALGRLATGLVLPALMLSGCTVESMMSTHAPKFVQIFPENEPVPAGVGDPGGLNGQIARYSALYHVPESLIRRIIVRESGYNAAARHGPYWGLMQIRYDTARSMGYNGAPAGLLNADNNLRYGVKYLAGAYLVAHGDPEKAVSFYASGYFYDARRLGLLEEVGLKRGK